MSDLYFPTTLALPGLVLDSRTSFYDDTVQSATAGNEHRVNRYAAPRYRYSFHVTAMRDRLSELATLQGFWTAHDGRRDSFYLTDPIDDVARRVRFDEPELQVERVAVGVYSCAFDLVTVVV